MKRAAVIFGILGFAIGCGGGVTGTDPYRLPAPDPGGDRTTAAGTNEEDPAQTNGTGVPSQPRGAQQACGRPRIDILDCATDAGYEVNSYRATSAADLEVNVIGVYETRSDHHGADYHPTGEASVHVSRHARQILVLSSYEPTHWTVTIDPGVTVEKIVTLGYEAQTVSFQGGAAPIDDRGFACGYSWPYNGQGCDTNALFGSATKASGSSVSAFAGCYRANTFAVRDGDGCQ